MSGLWRLDAAAQAALVRERSVRPIELVEAAIARIRSLNPKLDAVDAMQGLSGRPMGDALVVCARD